MLAGLTLIPMSLHARRLTPEEALLRAMPEVTRRAPARVAKPEPVPVYTVTDSLASPMAYVFANGAESGYMVVSADDVATGLLGYADHGTFSASDMPDNLRWWLDGYAREISYAASHAGAGMTSGRAAAKPEHEPIAPLLSTKWDQSTPYNNMCPVYDGKRCMVGCVATAMAQIMNYHKWPERGHGVFSYTTETYGIEIECDLSDITFDWDNMLDTYTADSPAEACDAVAALMYAAGVSEHMNYGPNASGASESVAATLRDCFDYDVATTLRSREMYTIDEWDEIIYNSLATSGPVYYTGANSGAAHAFVCDGYSSDGYYHFNWGWSGMSDGYFLLSALDPDAQGIGGSTAGYSYAQTAVTGIRPPQENSEPEYLLTRSGYFTCSTESPALGAEIDFDFGMFNSGDYDIPAGTAITGGVRMTSPSGASTVLHMTTPDGYTGGLAAGYGWGELSVMLPPALSAGTYKLQTVYSIGDGDWTELRPRYACFRNELYMTVAADKSISFSTVASAISIDDVALTPVYMGYQFRASCHYENVGGQDFGSGICGAFMKPGTNDGDGCVAIGRVLQLQEAPGAAGEFDYISDIFITTDDFGPGEYEFCFIDYVAYAVGQFVSYSAPVKVTVNAEPTEAMRLVSTDITASGTETDGVVSVSVDTDVRCVSGYFTSTLTVFVFNNDGKSVSSRATETLFLGKGDLTDIHADIQFQGTPGRYIAGLYYYDAASGWVNLSSKAFGVTHEESALTDIDADADAPEIIYDMQGRRVTSPRHPGLYIVNGTKRFLRP